MKRKAGRPPIDDPRTSWVHVRVTTRELTGIESDARRLGHRDVSAYVRSVLVEEHPRILDDPRGES